MKGNWNYQPDRDYWQFRNPFAAVWGVLDRDDALWLTGEHYRNRPLSHHAERLPRTVRWYADPWTGDRSLNQVK